MDSHKLALIDSCTGKYQDIQVADDYVSVITLTLELQEEAKKSGRIGVHAVSDSASELTPAFLEGHGFESVPKSVAYGYTASGYGFVQDMPYAYIHEFTRTSMAGKIRRFKGGYMSFWEKISESLPAEILCNNEVTSIRRRSSGIEIEVRQNGETTSSLEFDKLIVSGAFPFIHGKTYRSPSIAPTAALSPSSLTHPQNLGDVAGNTSLAHYNPLINEARESARKKANDDGAVASKSLCAELAHQGCALSLARWGLRTEDARLTLLCRGMRAELPVMPSFRYWVPPPWAWDVSNGIRADPGYARLDLGASLVDKRRDLMDFSELERELFSKVQTIDYYTTVLRIKGFENLPVGFYYFGEFMDDPQTIGNPVAMQRSYSDTDVFLFWSYGNSAEIKGQEVTQLALDAVKRMGGEVISVVLQRRFNYFPHVQTQDMKQGFYDRIEKELQGEHSTYYVGGLMAFELTERNSSYAMALVGRHFACDDPLPRFPYVKSLFSVMPECCSKVPQKLDETKGVVFPDLSSLDCYVKHWGTQCIIKNKILYTWLDDDGEVLGRRTYEELHANADCIAEKLLSSRKPVIKPGDRVLLIHVPGLEFIDAFFGCLRARVLPVPVLPPDPLQRGGQALLKIENVAKSCNAVAILSTLGYHSAVRAGLMKNLLPFYKASGQSSARWPNLPWIHTDSWIRKSKGLPAANVDSTSIAPETDDLCFLQFTSGSTGDAKGVMITHGGIVHNVKLMRRRYRSTSSTVLVSWLPQYHDMGLIGGLFTALVSGGTAVLFSPMTFIKNPLLWLETMSKYKAS
ncbi:hypothetical protein C2S53_017070 [Perilla frutescens var. hirtella]|uniref:AMP-dependent synthetase/ligase domain-containing protein n=1 Tax=Perilla frutescens var. hirtella TaxID=608512 RepID=A0AAD4IQE4_PERFH|nr:hypothetical protein C2S53_017070 [Perilla frutescens var. hirtella]